MNTYSLSKLDFYGEMRFEGTQVAETPGKAKYQHFLEYADCVPDEGFGDFVKGLRCHKVHEFRVSDLFGDRQQFERMCELRSIPFAELGMRVEVDGSTGTIVGSNNSLNLDVCFDGKHWAENCHPWWRTKYFDHDGHLIKEYQG